MEAWHQKKYIKYDPICEAMKLNGWQVHLFPVEVGARGYCSTSVKSCLFRLGFSNKVVKSALKSLSVASIKASFYVWQSRDSFEWKNPSNPKSSNLDSQEQGKTFQCTNSQTGFSKSRTNKTKPPHTDSYSQPPPKNFVKAHVGLFNKGNTCYINSCLQCLSVMPEFWSCFSNLPRLSPFVSSFLRIMTMLTSSKASVDPSQFLRFLEQVLRKSGKSDFNLFQQQDACEILSCILDELWGESPTATNLTKVHLKNTITCNTCLENNIHEDPFSILQLPVADSVQQSVDMFLRSEDLIGTNSYFCNVCSSHQPAVLEHEFSRLGNFLIIQLKRFSNFSGSVTKDARKVWCTSDLNIPISVDNAITINKKFKLIGTVNHSGNLNSGHYTAHIADRFSSLWLHCNDSAVVQCKKSLANNSCYVLFYKAL